MTGKDAILNYLKTHKTCSSPDVAAASGMTHTCINQAANILAKQGGTGSGSSGVADGLLPAGHGRRNFRQKEHQSDFQRVSAKPGDEVGTGCLRENISMTITLQAVNELIASLESAGELSIREQKFLKLAKEFRICSASLDAAIKTGNMLADQNAQLAAENVEAKKIISECREYFIAGVMNRIRPTNEGYLHMICDTFADETPATDRIVAEAEARGVEKAIAHLEKKFSNIGVQIMNLQWLADSLREGAK